MTGFNRSVIKKLYHSDQYANRAYDYLMSIYDYFDFIVREQDKVALIEAERTWLDDEDYKNRIKSIDEQRKVKHDSAISSISILNRMAANEGLEKFYDGPIDYDPESREIIAREIIKYCKENADNDRYGTIE